MSLKNAFKLVLMLVLMLGIMQVAAPYATAQSSEELCEASGGEWDNKRAVGNNCVCLSGKVADGGVCKLPTEVTQSGSSCTAASSFLGFPTWYKYLDKEEINDRCSVVIPGQDGSEGSIADAVIPILIAVVEIMLRIVGLTSIGFVIYGGIKYILSQGQPDATKSARQIIINAVIGVAISIVASGAISFFATRLTASCDAEKRKVYQLN